MGENNERMDSFVQRVLATMNKRITDEVFLLIQNDCDLMQEYLGIVEASGVGTLNRRIGKAVKAAYGLNNADFREASPRSTLIRSHQIFE